MDEILRSVTEYWYVYLSMPLIAAVIGYVTKIVAIEMMFRPIEFVGRPPFLGWQGIIPRRAARMASIACDTMTEKLISPQEILGRLDAQRVAKEIEKPLLDNIESITRQVALQFQPGLWESIPESVRRLVIARVQRQAPQMIQNIMTSIQDDIDGVFDLIAQEIITPHNVIQSVLRGPLSDKLFAMVQREVQHVLDQQTSIARPLIVFAVGSTRYQEMKRAVSTQVMAALPATMLYVEDYAADAMDIRNTLVAKMQELSVEEFEELLRPAFEQDEWILITVGALLGCVVGELQSVMVVALID